MFRSGFSELLASTFFALTAWLGLSPSMTHAPGELRLVHAPGPIRALAQTADLSVDLHAHLFMKEGLDWFFRGDFNGPLKARNWKARFSSQANPETVEKSGVGVLVVSLYAANRILTWDMRQAIRRQIDLAERFVDEHPDWIIARSASDARRAIDQGKRVLVLSLEGASGILETDADIEEFVDRRGIRIVTFLHLMDDELGGAGFMRSYKEWTNFGPRVANLFHSHEDENTGVMVNPQGLTPKGREIAQKLIQHGVWLDLSHSSDAAQSELIPMIERAGHPVLYTHGPVRALHRAERGFSDAQLEAVKRTDGIIGIAPSEDFLTSTPVPELTCGWGCAYPCNHGLPAFVEHYKYAAAKLGARNVMVGTDFNGAIPHLPPTCGTRTELDRTGLWNIGQMSEFWRAVRNKGAPVPARMSEHVDSFLEKWSRVSR